MDLKIRTRCRLGKRGEKHLSIHVMLENVPVVSATVHHMMPGARKILSQWSRHGV
jgi:hypothetical protein